MASPPDPVKTVVTNGVDTHSSPQMSISPTVEGLQTDEQRRVLDTVSQVRKCGLESVLSLPQIVVCGDQSAGKSSVLEALTEIPFPRDDNLCTRFATEICLRRDAVDSLTIRVIPDSDRPQEKQVEIKKYSESITDFADLTQIMSNAKKVMGISDGGRAFAKDTLSIEICGPTRPQLTLVDIPGLIQTSTKGVSDTDVALVADITDHYIKQPRTICLAVISATNDAANQPILQRVRKFDPRGERTLGVITKPDRLSAGSGSEAKFLELARNEDVFFKLGWHVIKNRKFEEMQFSVDERNLSEKTFFSTSNFKTLSKDNVGIDTLRVRLSYLLFEHIKKELPRLHKDLESTLQVARDDFETLGKSRSTVAECRSFLIALSMECHEICRAAVSGNYDHPQLKDIPDCVDNPVPLRRLRAYVQWHNNVFAKEFNSKGHKFIIVPEISPPKKKSQSKKKSQCPQFMSKEGAKTWVERKIRHARGTELIGSFNPHVVAELFWEQSEPWEAITKTHVESISTACELFLTVLLKCMTKPWPELKQRIWNSMVSDTLSSRKKSALEELAKLIKDKNNVPINYNHYYIDSIHKKRVKRIEAQSKELRADKTSRRGNESSDSDDAFELDVKKPESAESESSDEATRDMEAFSCEESLDCLKAIYKVQQKVFVANVTTQVIERHLVADLNNIFSPMVVAGMTDAKIQRVVSEPESTKRLRTFLSDQIKRLEEGQNIFRGILDS